MLITVLITTKNEEKNMEELLKSLIIQEKPIEIIIVDAGSTDNTTTIIKNYAQKYPFIKLYNKEGTRGESMNYGIERAQGEAISFLGADDRADKDWIRYVRQSLKKRHDIVVGKCILVGNKKFSLDRVNLYHRGVDISYPGSNTTYRKKILDEIGGFDPKFITAEDIDLNYRAVDAGYNIYENEKAIVYRRVRSNVIEFLKQSFWNGYGRRQLVSKYGSMWSGYKISTFKKQFTLWGLFRLIFGSIGYLCCKIREVFDNLSHHGQ